MDMFIGSCKYCGQVVEVNHVCDSQEEANELATKNCSCDAAKKARHIEESVISAKAKLEELCGSESRFYGFSELSDETIAALENIIELIGSGIIGDTSCKVGLGTVKISMNIAGDIKIKRSEARNYTLSS